MVPKIIKIEAIGTVMQEITKSGLIFLPFKYMPIGTASNNTPKNRNEI